MALLALTGGLILFSWFYEEEREPERVVVYHQDLGNSGGKVLPSFERQEDEDTYYLTYGWSDFSGDILDLSFSLSKRLVNEAEEEFGYFQADLKKHMDDYAVRAQESMIVDLRVFVERLIQNSNYSDYILIEKITPKSFNLKLSVPPALHKKVKKVYDKIKIKLAKEQERQLKRMGEEQEKERTRFFDDHGIRVFGDSIGVNHSLCVTRNKERIKPVFEIMKNKYGHLSLLRFLETLLAFIQDVRYYIPPLQERGKTILSFWVPPRVLADNFGDCDSKGVTFACLWTHFKKYPVLLITVPNHFFVGLAIPSFSGEGLVLNGLRYTLCEVTGPGKMPPGIIGRYSQACLQNGQYFYEMVD